MLTLINFCKHCGEPIIQPWGGRDQPDKNGWRHLIIESEVVYYYCDREESTHAEPKQT